MDRGQWRHHLSRILLPLGALAAAAQLGQSWPKEQTVRYVLGDAAGRVEEIDASWEQFRQQGESEESLRDVSFRYALGQAPRVVTHRPRLPDGDYTVNIEIVAPSRRNVVQRHVTLRGGSTSIDLSDALLAPDAIPRSPGVGR